MRIRLLALPAAILALCVFLAPAHAETPGWTTALTLPGGGVSAITFASDTNAWAAGAGGIYRSTDAGRTWSIVYTTHELMLSIAAAPDGRHGWAVGSAGAILATRDGGASWHEQTSNTDINLSGVAVLDTTHVFAVGTGVGFSDVIQLPQPSIILETKDGGATWSEVRVSGDYEVHSIDFVADGKHGWMTASRCVPAEGPSPGPTNCARLEPALLATSDGGTSWAPVQTDASLYRIQFVDAKTGWATGATCTIGGCDGLLRTTDGGATWQHAASGQPAAFHAFDANSAVLASLECDNGCRTKVERTTDSGATWQPLATLDANVSTIAFRGRDVGVLAGQGPDAPLYTTDGGVTWQSAAFPAVAGSGTVSFPDATHGWFAASKLLRTTDGGATWAPVSDTAFDDIDFISGSEGWGTTLRCSGQCHIEVLHTTDGGSSWQQQYGADVPNPGQLTFVGPRDGWLVFPSEGRALHTLDGGATWHDQALPIAPPQGGNAGNVTFVGPNTGWAAIAICDPGYTNCIGHVSRSTDGGDSWTAVAPLPGACTIGSIMAVDASTAWVATFDCAASGTTLYRTTDGGAHWVSSSLPTPAVSALHFFDAMTGRAFAQVCDTSSCHVAIARSSDGGATWSLGAPVDAGYPGPTSFVKPDDIWMSANFAGGFTSTFAQALYHYQGTGQSPAPTPVAKITLPDTGASGGSLPLSLEVFALLALGVLSLAGAAVARRR